MQVFTVHGNRISRSLTNQIIYVHSNMISLSLTNKIVYIHSNMISSFNIAFLSFMTRSMTLCIAASIALFKQKYCILNVTFLCEMPNVEQNLIIQIPTLPHIDLFHCYFESVKNDS